MEESRRRRAIDDARIERFTDAVFTPLVQRQMVRARQADLQTARNDALLNVATAYFNVQRARGRLSGTQDVLEKSRRLVEEVRALGKDLVSPIEENRALTQLASTEREAALRYQDWRVVSADLTRELRLNPITVVAPLEPPELQVTLISPREPVDGLVPIGLTNRQHALVELFRVQDRVAAEVVQAHARVQAGVIAVNRAESEVKEALISFEGNLKGIRETYRFGDRLVAVNRPLEAVDALRQLERAYDRYFVSVGDYNRAQFELCRALGYPAGILACEKTPGEVMPVDANRPPQMAPVHAPPPCQHCVP